MPKNLEGKSDAEEVKVFQQKFSSGVTDENYSRELCQKLAHLLEERKSTYSRNLVSDEIRVLFSEENNTLSYDKGAILLTLSSNVKRTNIFLKVIDKYIKFSDLEMSNDPEFNEKYILDECRFFNYGFKTFNKNFDSITSELENKHVDEAFSLIYSCMNLELISNTMLFLLNVYQNVFDAWPDNNEVARPTAPQRLLDETKKKVGTDQERTPSGRLAARPRSQFDDPSKSASSRANRRDKQVGTSHSPALMELLNQAAEEKTPGKKQIVEEGIILRLQELGYDDELRKLGYIPK